MTVFLQSAVADGSGVSPSLIAILATLQILITVIQTLAMEYLRRRYPTGSQHPPAMSKRELERLRISPEFSLEPPPLIRHRDRSRENR